MELEINGQINSESHRAEIWSQNKFYPSGTDTCYKTPSRNQQRLHVVIQGKFRKTTLKTELGTGCLNSSCVCDCVSDPAGSEVQQLSGLVVVRGAAVRDADRSVSVPRPR